MIGNGVIYFGFKIVIVSSFVMIKLKIYVDWNKKKLRLFVLFKYFFVIGFYVLWIVGY